LLLLPILSYTKKEAMFASKIEFEVEKKGKIACRTDAIIAQLKQSTTAQNCTLLISNILKPFKNSELDRYP